MKIKIILGLVFIFAVSDLSSQSYQWWSARFSSPASGSQDTSVAIKQDNAGNIYVTGCVNGNNTGTDIILLKYNTVTGDTVWVRYYSSQGLNEDKATALEVDALGFVYLTGYTFQSSRDIITLKYDPAGNLVWAKTFNGSNNGGDYGLAIEIDAAGNVYVGGRSDDAGDQHFTAVKYSSAGTQLWASVYNGPLSRSFDQPDDITIDNNGNIYLAGFSTVMQDLHTSDYLTVKFNSNGNLQWAKRYNGTADDEDAATGIIYVNSAVYVTGRTDSLNGNYNYFTIKYNDANGDSLKSAFYSGPPLRQIDNAVRIKADNAGNVYVTGLSMGVNNTFDYATVKYNSDLDLQWVSRFEGTGFDTPSDMVIAGSDIYVTGASDGVSSKDYLTVKYNSSGSEQWTMRFNAPAGENDFASSVAVDQFENVYVTGYAGVTGGENDIFTLRYSPVPIGVEPVSGSIPLSYKLYQNYPNPFNPSTNIRIDIPAGNDRYTKLEIFDVLGKLISVPVNDDLKPGTYIVNWNASGTASGVLYYRLSSGDFIQTNKMILIK